MIRWSGLTRKFGRKSLLNRLAKRDGAKKSGGAAPFVPMDDKDLAEAEIEFGEMSKFGYDGREELYRLVCSYMAEFEVTRGEVDVPTLADDSRRMMDDPLMGSAIGNGEGVCDDIARTRRYDGKFLFGLMLEFAEGSQELNMKKLRGVCPNPKFIFRPRIHRTDVSYWDKMDHPLCGWLRMVWSKARGLRGEEVPARIYGLPFVSGGP